ncbi:MAG TPA: aminopeptidase [Acidobacteriota bacterium]|nr:aminopeptidase [Acidobacteriota bacterium]
MTFNPSQKILDNWANVLVNFAANGGSGVKPGQSILINIGESAKPLLLSVYRAVLAAGAHPIVLYQPDLLSKELFSNASDEQLSFYPKAYYDGIVDQADCLIFVRAEVDKKELVGIDPKKLLLRQKAFKPYMDRRRVKENAGNFTWVLTSYPTQSVANEAGLTLEQYWQQVIQACYLDSSDPVSEWKRVFSQIDATKAALDDLEIESLHIIAPGTDLTVKLGPNRRWLGGSGRNLPSFELYISPDWRGTSGTVTFTEPLYVYGNLVKDVTLTFRNGVASLAKASQGEAVLLEMIRQKNADKIGEFSLTDKRLSRITKFMADTLFDENVGGSHGNMHLALGNAYQDSYPGDASRVDAQSWEDWGYNSSSVHTDIVATTPRIVTATLKDGTHKVIYKDGVFTV